MFVFVLNFLFYQRTEKFEIGLIFFYPMRNRWGKKAVENHTIIKLHGFFGKKHFSIFFETKIVHYFILKICTGNRKEG